MKNTRPKTPSDVDVIVGQNLRSFRQLAKTSQQDLAAKAGISYQQIQKYEVGTNRISASRMYKLASVLEVSIGDFFHGLDHKTAKAPPLSDIDKETAEFVRLFQKISDSKVKEGLLVILKTYVGST